METKIEKLKNQYKIKLTLTKDELNKEIEAAYTATANKYRVQGFRAGKAPRGVIEKNYGTNIFIDEAKGRVLSREYTRVLREYPNIKPIDYPDADVNDDGTEITLTVDVVPEFAIGKYTGHEIKRGSVKVADGEVEDFLSTQAKMRARQIAAEKGYKIQNGDTAVIDFVGSVDGVEFDGGAAKNHELEIGSNSFIDNFEQQLIGRAIGEQVKVNVTFPEKYHAENLAGKKALFVVDIKNVLKREIPAINDIFAKEASEFNNLADWKKDVLAKLTESAEARAITEAKNELLKRIIEGTKIDVPEKMIEMKFAEIIEDMKAQLAQQGATVEMYAQHMNMPIEKIMETQRENAIRSVKARLVLDAITVKEGIEVTDKDVKEKIEEMAAKYDKDAAKVFKDPSKLEWLREDLRFEKLMNWLVKNNNI